MIFTVIVNSVLYVFSFILNTLRRYPYACVECIKCITHVLVKVQYIKRCRNIYDNNGSLRT